MREPKIALEVQKIRIHSILHEGHYAVVSIILGVVWFSFFAKLV